MPSPCNPATLSDQELTVALAKLNREDYQLTARLVAHIAEFDARQLYLAKAYSSMHVYCTDRLGMTDAEAFRRIHAGRAARKHPQILTLIADGELKLSGVTLLAPKLTAQNASELIEAARGKSKRALELWLATRFPQPDVQATIRKLPAPRTERAARGGDPIEAPGPEDLEPRELHRELPMVPPPQRPGLVAPLSPARFKIEFTADKELRDQLTEARALLRHQIPNGDIAQIFARALSLLLSDVKKKKLAATSKPRARPRPKSEPGSEGSRHIPADVKRQVVERDGLRCSFTDDTGRRCKETGFLEFHHIDPHGKGGPPTVDNVSIHCWAHNQYAAQLDYGAQHMARQRKRRAGKRAALFPGEAGPPGSAGPPV